MYSANVLAYFSKGSNAAKWIGLAVAILGVALLFSDLFMNIKKRNHTKMNIVALVFLSLSLVCYVLTQWVFTSLPPMVGFIWVVFLVAYFVCDIILAVGIGRDNRRKKRGLGSSDEDESETEAEAKTEPESANEPTAEASEQTDGEAKPDNTESK